MKLSYFIYEIKYVFVLSYRGESGSEGNVWENSRADQWKLETRSRVFTRSRILTSFAEFSRGSGGMENCYFLAKERERRYTKRTWSFISFIKLLTVTTWWQQNVISCLIALWKDICRPIRMHVVSELFYNYSFAS